MKPEIFGVEIDPLTIAGVVRRIDQSIKKGERLTVATVNAEFLMEAKGDTDFHARLMKMDLRLPDGIGVLWAATYLALPWRGRLWAGWQLVYSGASLLLYPKFSRRLITTNVPGSLLVPKLAEEASENNWSIFLLGAGPGVADALAERWRTKYPGLKVSASRADPDDREVLAKIKDVKPNLIFLAYPANQQLTWLTTNLPSLPPAVGIGVGGTFDYLLGSRTTQPNPTARDYRTSTHPRRFRARRPPRIINYFGLEWLWRLVTQPWRWRRIWIAVPIFMKNVLQYKSQQAVNRNS